MVIGFILVLCVLFMKEGVTGWLFRIAGGRVGEKIAAADPAFVEPVGPGAAMSSQEVAR
jgi:hypothetical protein